MLTKIFPGFLALLIASGASANDQERAEIERLITSLESTYPLIESASRSSNPYDRYIVDYEAISDDIRMIVDGLQEVIDLPRREPRIPNPQSEHPVNGTYSK